MAINVLKEEVKQATAGVINFVSSAATTSSTTVITTTTGGITTTSTTTVGITTTTSFAPIEGCCGDCYCSPSYIVGTIEVTCSARQKAAAVGAPFPLGCTDRDLDNWSGNCTYGVASGLCCDYYLVGGVPGPPYITLGRGCWAVGYNCVTKHDYVSDTCQKKA